MASSSFSRSLPSSSLPRSWEHDVFMSFHGRDVRKGFLSHILKEFERTGITPFIDNNIKRGESIAPELKRAIQESKIAVVLLSKNYASSSWCLDELVEIMSKVAGQTVFAIFYEVDPTDVKKQTEDFGKVFNEICQSKATEKTETWRKSLKGVATIAGYHSKHSVDEATMIEQIAANISIMLNHLEPPPDLDRLIGMIAHLERMEPLLRPDPKVLKAHGINHIYKVDYPTHDEALQIFCMYAFVQQSPYDGFEELAREVIRVMSKVSLAPLGLRDMGFAFRGMSKEEWKFDLYLLRGSYWCLSGFVKLHRFFNEPYYEETSDNDELEETSDDELEETLDELFEETLDIVKKPLDVLEDTFDVLEETSDELEEIFDELFRW